VRLGIVLSHHACSGLSSLRSWRGATRIITGTDLPDRYNNTLFTAIANEAVEAGIIRDMDEACMQTYSERSKELDTMLTAAIDILILPALAYHGLLPKDSGGMTIKFEEGERTEAG